MTVDPESMEHYPSQAMRQVKAGHYVPVKPTPLPNPRLVIHSPEMAAELGLSENHCVSDEFTRFFSGDTSAVPESSSWATPYALSIYGQFQRNGQCPFRNGCGYGDGRAISIQEMQTPSGARWELQLKGAGRTPFCRGGDGRAVLRSSIREFLASEAMHHLGVGTTRALCLVISQSEAARRPKPEEDERGMQMESSRSLVAQLLLFSEWGIWNSSGDLGVGTTRALSLVVSQSEAARRPKPEEDRMGIQMESCAITCRAATSFLRVGHLELFGRRAANPPKGCGPALDAVRSLEMLVDHALQREFAIAPAENTPISERSWTLIKHTVERVANMTVQWLRVGFCQGNFNSDNCLLSGRTMDYGPFGFVEQFDPRFGSWEGSGSHFAFMNQTQAGMMNMRSLTEALAPLLDEDEDQAWDKVKALYLQESEQAKTEMWRKKLGLHNWSSEAAALLSDLLRLMQESEADWTITWRQLAACLEVPPGSSDDDLLKPIVSLQSESDAITCRSETWVSWLKRWVTMVDDEGSGRSVAADSIRATSPKYVPREWMLKEAYTAAQQGDFSLVKQLFDLFKHPYAEQESHMRFYASKPTVASADLRKRRAAAGLVAILRRSACLALSDVVG
eukprot:CAMPEP_0172780562 /NCGR_PEP_ID=MMETSP1074-20121228/202989_1 /TAXON_ID=2916 /ORGANISM="Ceratium fusus, Strain PA161109" /LENGTH=620 /DNA_ID=CAMNT_0013617539 /DNA_START=35 /DNA_END=1899 /DNA_ORIENTATION=+